MRRAAAILLTTSVLLGAGVTPAAPQEDAPILYSAYRYSGRGAGAAIFTVTPGGEPVRLTGSRAFNLEPVWSPDRSQIAFVHSARPRNPDIWLMDADGGDRVRLTSGRRDDVYPQWSPDGTHIAWVKETPLGGTAGIYVMHPDGRDKTAVSPERHRAAMPAWAPDGHFVAYAAERRCRDCRTDAEIYYVDGHTTDSQPVRLTDNDVHDVTPMWSPSGDVLAFARDRGDGSDIFTVTADGSEERRLTDLDGYAVLPRWSPDGTEIAFTLIVDVENFHTRLAVVDVATGEERLLTEVETGGIQPDWSPDGSRIAFIGFHSGGHNVGVIGRDGTGAAQLTDSDLDEAWVDW